MGPVFARLLAAAIQQALKQQKVAGKRPKPNPAHQRRKEYRDHAMDKSSVLAIAARRRPGRHTNPVRSRGRRFHDVFKDEQRIVDQKILRGRTLDKARKDLKEGEKQWSQQGGEYGDELDKVLQNLKSAIRRQAARDKGITKP